MYFASRLQAGRMLANQIAEKYDDTPCMVVALSDASAVVAAQVAMRMRAGLSVLVATDIQLPPELQLDPDAIAVPIMSDQLEEHVKEQRGFLEGGKLAKIQARHQLVGNAGTMQRTVLDNHTVIIVSDGLKSGLSFDLAMQYLRPVPAARLVIATPLASITAVDHMHVLADDIFCLSVIENYMGVAHYYDNSDVPDHQTVLDMMTRSSQQWE